MGTFDQYRQPVDQEITDDSSVKEEEIYGVGRFLWEIVKIILLAVFIIIPVRVIFFQPFFVEGTSMEPNFRDGEYLIVGEFGYKETKVGVGDTEFFRFTPFKQLNRGDVVVFRPPGVSDQFYIKRTVGLPGETVEIKDGFVVIRNSQSPSGFILDEALYLRPRLETSGNQIVKLADDEYFLMGDNRRASRDSRSFGPVKKNLIMGKVLIRAWPIDRMNAF